MRGVVKKEAYIAERRSFEGIKITRYLLEKDGQDAYLYTASL